MKRFIVLLALCFLTIVTAAGCFGGSDRFAPHTAGPQHTQAAETAAGGRSPEASGSDVPAQTAAPDPEHTPSGQAVQQAGSIRSHTGTALNLRVDWTAKQRAGDEMIMVTAEVYLECASIEVSGREGGLIRIQGNTQKFDTDPIRRTDQQPHEIMIAVYAQQVAADPSGKTEIMIEAQWDFRGSYSGVPLENLTASERITVG